MSGVQTYPSPAPDYSDVTQTGSTYPINIDKALAVHHRHGGWFAPHQQDVGSPAPEMSMRLDAGFVWGQVSAGSGNKATPTEIAAQTVSGFAAPSASAVRIDRVVVDEFTGVAARVAGTEAVGSPSAVAPQIPPGNIPICRITFTSSDTAVLNSMITDERTFGRRPANYAAQQVINFSYTHGDSGGTGDTSHDMTFSLEGRGQVLTVLSEDFVLGNVRKEFDSTWSIGDGGGGMASGNSLQANHCYYVSVIVRLADGAIDLIAKDNAGGGSLPAGWVSIGLIVMWFFTDGSSILRLTKQICKWQFRFVTPIADKAAQSVGISRVLVTLTAPPSSLARFRATFFNSGNPANLLIQPTDETDAAPVFGASPGVTLRSEVANSGVAGEFSIPTDASRQIAVRAGTAASTYDIIALGWDYDPN